MLTYVRADSLDHALEVIADVDDDLKVLAGGQSLLPMMNLRLAQPTRLLDIGRLDELAGVTVGPDVVRLGALVRHRELERPTPGIAVAAPLLPEAAPRIGHAAIRERGTFGGSIAHGDPAAEWPACAVALDATLVLRSARGERHVPADGFYVGPLTTILEPDELLVAVEVVPAPPGAGVAIEELTYRHGDYAVVGIAAQVVASPDGGVSDVRIGLFGVDGTPVRARDAERILVEGGLDALEEAAAAASAACEPSSDVTASAAYRTRMVAVFTRRAVQTAWRRSVDALATGRASAGTAPHAAVEAA